MLLKKSIAALIASSFALLLATSASAQERQVREVNKPVLGTQVANGADTQLANCLIGANENEIALAKVAEQKAKSNDVKQFAQMMVKDHGDFINQLQRFAGERSTTGQMTTGRAQQRAAENATTVGMAAQPMGSQTLDFAALDKQIAQKCLDLVRKDMEEKSGTEFDKCYIGSQIGAHMHVLATLEVFRNQASPELGSVLDKGIETTKSHLDKAQQIAKSLDKQQG
jgi:predicted outer membrane protein